MAVIFGKWNIQWNLERLVFTDTLWVKNFAEIPLVNFYFMKKMVSKSAHISLYHLELFYICTSWAYISNFVFCISCQKFENLIWPPFLGRRNFFENWRVVSLDTLCIENFDEIALSHIVRRYKQFCVLLVKKIVNALLIINNSVISYPIPAKI